MRNEWIWTEGDINKWKCSSIEDPSIVNDIFYFFT